MAFEKAVPPASASRPTDDSAVAKPSICDCVRPTCAPAAPSRVAMFIMALSVVAKLLPKSTNAAPKRPKSLCAIFVTLANCAMAVAASSATIVGGIAQVDHGAGEVYQIVVLDAQLSGVRHDLGNVTGGGGDLGGHPLD